MRKRVEFQLKELLIKRGIKLAVAESCTGGMVASRIVNVPGSSEYFMGGIVAYDNHIKMKVLGINPETIIKYGAVSEQTAAEMVSGVKKLMGTECGISTTGIAGPGGSGDKPEGLVYIGVSVGKNIEVFKFIFKDTTPDPVSRRNAIRRKAAKKAIQMLVRMLKET